jgi:hypothetical protein
VRKLVQRFLKHGFSFALLLEDWVGLGAGGGGMGLFTAKRD